MLKHRNNNKYYLNMGICQEFTEEDIKFRYINDAIISN